MAAPDPRLLLPRGTALQRRVVLAEVVGPPRARAPWRPLTVVPPPPEPKEP